MQKRRKLTLGLLLIRRNECSLLNVIWQQKAVEPSHYLVKYQGISLLNGNFDLEIKTQIANEHLYETILALKRLNFTIMTISN